jgi:tape measure domain-containing protein
VSEQIIISHNLADVNAKLDQLVTRLGRVQLAYKTLTAQVHRFNNAMSGTSGTMNRQSRGFDRAASSANAYAVAIRRASTNFGTMGGGKAGSGHIYTFSEGIRNMNMGVQKANKGMSLMSSLWMRFAAIGAARILWGVGSAAVRTSANLDAMRKSMDFAVGGEARGGVEFDRARAVSDQLGLAFMPATEGLTKLHAAMRGTDFNRRDATKLFTGISQAISVLGLNSERAHGTYMAFEQIISKGKVSMEELRRQLGDRIPGAFQIAARAMKMTTSELDLLIRKGNLSSFEFITKMAAQLEKEFAEGSIRSSETLMSNLNRLDNAWKDFQKTLGGGEAGVNAVKVTTDAVGLLELAIKAAGKAWDFFVWDRTPGFVQTFLRGAYGAATGRGYRAEQVGQRAVYALDLNDSGLEDKYSTLLDNRKQFGAGSTTYLDSLRPAFETEALKQQNAAMGIGADAKNLAFELEERGYVPYAIQWRAKKTDDRINQMLDEINPLSQQKKLDKDGNPIDPAGSMAEVLGGGNRILNVTIGNIIEKNENNFTAGDPVKQQGESEAASDVVVQALISTLQDLGQM